MHTQYTNQIKILFLINSIGIGGAEKVFAKQSKYLENNHFKIWRGIVFGDAKQVDGWLNFNFSNLFDLKAYLRLIIFCKKNKLDYIYATLDQAIFVSRVLKFFYPKIKIIIRESGMADRKSWKMKLSDCLFNFLTHKIVAVSNKVAQSLVAYQSFYRRKIIVINNGVDIFLDLDSLKKIRQDKNEQEIVIMNVGSMQNNNKGQAGLIDVFKNISHDYPAFNLKLCLVGDGKNKAMLESQVKSLNLTNRVKFFGAVDTLVLNDLYKQADIFVLNSKNEGCPNVVLEAMSFSLALTVSDVGGVEEIVENKKSGLIFAVDDQVSLEKKLSLLIADKNLRLSLGENAYNFVKTNMTWEKQNLRLKELFIK